MAAKLAFEQCVRKEKVEDRGGSYHFKVHYNYDYVEDFRNLYKDQGPKITEASETDRESTDHATETCRVESVVEYNERERESGGI